jgi:hypothetical protein
MCVVNILPRASRDKVLILGHCVNKHLPHPLPQGSVAGQQQVSVELCSMFDGFVAKWPWVQLMVRHIHGMARVICGLFLKKLLVFLFLKDCCTFCKVYLAQNQS